MSIGDINSNERGSGARYNTNKPPLDLIPLSIIAGSFYSAFPHSSAESQVVLSLDFLGEFQTSGRVDYLEEAINAVRFAWRDCARVFEYGKTKYAEWNWAKGMNWSVALGCAGRHALWYLEGQENDKESGHPHVGHYLANLVMLSHFAANYPEGDDLPPPQLFVSPPGKIAIRGRSADTVIVDDIYMDNHSSTTLSDAMVRARPGVDVCAPVETAALIRN